jgi:hypothetical protein
MKNEKKVLSPEMQALIDMKSQAKKLALDCCNVCELRGPSCATCESTWNLDLKRFFMSNYRRKR